MTTILADDFAGTGALGSPWVLTTGWSRVSGKLVNAGGGGGSEYTYAPMGSDNHRATALFDWVTPGSGVNEVGIVGRLKDSNNYLLWVYVYNAGDVNDRAYKLYARIGGSYLDREFVAAAPPSGQIEMAMQCDGPEVRCYANGALITAYTLVAADRTALTGGSNAGVYVVAGTSSPADSFLAETPSTATPSEKITDAPGAITGLVGRWRADKIPSAVDGVAVWNWPDSSASKNHMVMNSARAIYDATGPGSHPSVHFGTGQRFETNQDFTSDYSGGLDFTLSMVVKFDATSATYNTFAGGEGGGSMSFYRKDGSGGRYAAYAGGAELISSTSIDTSLHVLTYVITSARTACKIYLDGTEVASGSMGSGTLNRLRFAPGDSTMTNDLSEAFLFKGALDSTARSTVHSYVQERYGVTVSDYVATGPPAGSGSGSLAYTGAAVGKRTPKGSRAASWTYAGVAVGKRAPKGAGTGTWTEVGTGAGKRAPKASASGAWTYTGAAAGKRTPKTSSTGAFAFTGTSAGVAPTVGLPTGTGTGAWSLVGAATGKRTPKASRSGAFTFAGTAVGIAGSASALVTPPGRTLIVEAEDRVQVAQ